MVKDKHTILGVHVDDRLKEALKVQKLLTQHGDFIKTRLGLHEIGKSRNAKNGLLILEMVGPDVKIRQLSDKLNAITGVEVQSMVFGHAGRRRG
ncbi:MAG: hypothetical protein HZA50_16810 [Planctomycetes bacterium]|nr:hypothetical protein [Planctomycetota bacterium]